MKVEEGISKIMVMEKYDKNKLLKIKNKKVAFIMDYLDTMQTSITIN